MVFTNVINPRNFIVIRDEFKRTLLKKGCTVGANATIVCGNKIGKYAFIGAGAVITKDVPDYALVVGNPGRQIGGISENGCSLQFNSNGVAICHESCVKYFLSNNKVDKLE